MIRPRIAVGYCDNIVVKVAAAVPERFVHIKDIEYLEADEPTDA